MEGSVKVIKDFLAGRITFLRLLVILVVLLVVGLFAASLTGIVEQLAVENFEEVRPKLESTVLVPIWSLVIAGLILVIILGLGVLIWVRSSNNRNTKLITNGFVEEKPNSLSQGEVFAKIQDMQEGKIQPSEFQAFMQDALNSRKISKSRADSFLRDAGFEAKFTNGLYVVSPKRRV